MSTYPLTMSVLGVNVRDSVAVTAVPPEYGYCLIVTVTVRLTELLPQVPELIRNTVPVEPAGQPADDGHRVLSRPVGGVSAVADRDDRGQRGGLLAVGHVREQRHERDDAAGAVGQFHLP